MAYSYNYVVFTEEAVIRRLEFQGLARPSYSILNHRASWLQRVICVVGMLAIGAAAVEDAAAATLTFDGSGHSPTNPVGSSNTWSTTVADWSNGTTDVAWPSDPAGTVATITNGVLSGGFGPIVTINDPTYHTVYVAGMNLFANIPASATIVAAPGNTLTLTAPEINGVGEIKAPITGSVGLTVGSSVVPLILAGQNTYTGTTNCGSGLQLATGGSLGNTSIVGVFTAGGVFGPGSCSAGTSGPGTSGATLDTSNLEVIVPFTLKQESSFSGTALTLESASVGIIPGNELIVSGPGTASVLGTQVVAFDMVDQPVPGSYTLISVPSGGLLGNFQFPNGLSSDSLTYNGTMYDFQLNDSNTALTESITQLPEPAGGIMLLIGATGGLILRRGVRRRTKRNDRPA